MLYRDKITLKSNSLPPLFIIDLKDIINVLVVQLCMRSKSWVLIATIQRSQKRYNLRR